MTKFCPPVRSLGGLFPSCDRYLLHWTEGNVSILSVRTVETILYNTMKCCNTSMLIACFPSIHEYFSHTSSSGKVKCFPCWFQDHLQSHNTTDTQSLSECTMLTVALILRIYMGGGDENQSKMKERQTDALRKLNIVLLVRLCRHSQIKDTDADL